MTYAKGITTIMLGWKILQKEVEKTVNLNIYLVSNWLTDSSVPLNGNDHSKENTGGDRYMGYTLRHVEQVVSYGARP